MQTFQGTQGRVGPEKLIKLLSRTIWRKLLVIRAKRLIEGAPFPFDLKNKTRQPPESTVFVLVFVDLFLIIFVLLFLFQL